MEESRNREQPRRLWRRSYTLLIVPHTGESFSKIRLKGQNLLTGSVVLLFMLFLFGVSLVFNYRLFSLYGLPLEPAEVDTGAIADSLESSAQQIDQALREARRAMVSLQEAADDQRKELEEVRGRYESLKILAEGQEQIAEAHRTILQDIGPVRRIFDMALGLLIGIIGGIASNAIWVSWKKRESQTADDLPREIRQQVLDEIEEQQREEGLADEAMMSQRDDFE